MSGEKYLSVSRPGHSPDDMLEGARRSLLFEIAHDFRSPLAAILSFSEMLTDSYKHDEQLCEDLETISTAAMGPMQLTDKVLDLAEREAGQREVRPSRFELLDLFREVARVHRSCNRASHNKVEIELPETFEPIFVDRDKLRRVLLDLLSRASRSTTKGLITLRAFLDGNNSVVIEVEDTGARMDQEMYDRAFERARDQDHSSEHDQGSELWLHATADLVALMGGKISCESTEGEGTTFSIYLPSETADTRSENMQQYAR